MGAPRDYSHTFGGAGSVEVKMAGRYIRVLEAPSSSLFIRVSSGSELKRVAGQAIDAGTTGFTSFSIRSTVAQTVLLVISDTPQDDNQQTVNATVTATVAPANTLPAGGDVSILALTSGQVLAADVTRIAAVIQNISDQTLRIGGAGVGATSGVPLEPGEKIVLETTAIIAAFNPHATLAKSVAVLPIQEV